MAKVEVTATDESGKQTKFETKTLTKLFKNKAGKVFKISIQEPGQDGVDLGNYTVKGGPIPENKSPVVEAGENRTVNHGELVVIDASATDPEGGTVEVAFIQEGGIPVNLERDPNDITIASFISPEEDTVITFGVIARDAQGATSTDKVVITVGVPPEPPVPPVEGQIDISKLWATGQNVDIMKGKPHKDGNGDTDGFIFAAEPTLYASHAGGGDSADRKIIMTADGKAEVTGDMARIYDETNPNYNNVWEFDICRLDSWAGEKFDSGNFSFKDRNRHQFGGAPSNRNGGIGSHFGEDYSGAKAELEHGNDVGIANDKKYPNGKKLELGKTYKVKFEHYDEPGKVNTIHVKNYVDFNDGNGYTLVLDVVKSLPASLFNRALYEKGSSIWFRNNGSGTSIFSNGKLKKLP